MRGCPRRGTWVVGAVRAAEIIVNRDPIDDTRHAPGAAGHSPDSHVCERTHWPVHVAAHDSIINCNLPSMIVWPRNTVTSTWYLDLMVTRFSIHPVRAPIDTPPARHTEHVVRPFSIADDRSLLADATVL